MVCLKKRKKVRRCHEPLTVAHHRPPCGGILRFLTRARASFSAPLPVATEVARGSRGDWRSRRSRGAVRIRGWPTPHPLPSRLNGRRGTLDGCALWPPVVDSRSLGALRGPEDSVRGHAVALPGARRHALVGRAFWAHAVSPPKCARVHRAAEAALPGPSTEARGHGWGRFMNLPVGHARRE